jgi:hypothetical protein
MISDFAEDVIARAIREGVTLAPTADGLRIHYQAHVAPLSASLRARLLEHKPAILAVLLAGGIKSFPGGSPLSTSTASQSSSVKPTPRPRRSSRR